MAANRKAIKALREIGKSYEARTWIIDKLFAANGSVPLRFCSFNVYSALRYNARALNTTFRDELKKMWPSLDGVRTDNQLWKKNYNKFGCCVNSSVLGYFQNAMRLIENWNIGQILLGSGIHPGGTYELSRILDSITNVSSTRPYVKCLPDENSWSDEQYLVEVQICFNKRSQFIDCDTRVDNLCDPRKPVFYPGSPEP